MGLQMPLDVYYSSLVEAELWDHLLFQPFYSLTFDWKFLSSLRIGNDRFNFVFGSMTWDRNCGSTTPWSPLSPTWGLPEPVLSKEDHTCSSVEHLTWND